MKKRSAEDMKEYILRHLSYGKSRAITTTELMRRTGLSDATIKNTIADLRMEYPICAQKESPGGYWIATTKEEIETFIFMLTRRKLTHEKTIKQMFSHLEDHYYSKE